MREAKVILARYKKGIMSKEQVLSYLVVCGMDMDTKMYVFNNL